MPTPLSGGAEGVWVYTIEAQSKPMLRIYTPGLRQQRIFTTDRLITPPPHVGGEMTYQCPCQLNLQTHSHQKEDAGLVPSIEHNLTEGRLLLPPMALPKLS